MEKLSTFKEELFNKNNLKKMVKVGVFATALGAAVLGGVGCKQPDDGTTIEDPTNGGNQGGNQQGGNSQGGNQQGGNTGNEQQGGNNQGGNQQGGNNQGGNQGGNTGNEQPSDDKYAAPFDEKLGNGNYTLHSFSGDGFSFQPDETLDAVTHYLDKGKTYYTDMVNQFKQSTSGHTSYFNEVASSLTSNDGILDNFKLSPDRTNLDLLPSNIASSCVPVYEDIIMNLDNAQERMQFMVCYGVLSNEAFRIGLNRNNPNSQEMIAYQEDKEKMADLWSRKTVAGNEKFDLTNDIDNQNCQQITNTMDGYLTQAANKMGQGVTAADLRQVVNISLLADSLSALHIRTRNNLNHKNACIGVINNIWNKMNDATQNAELVQEQAMVR